MYAAGDRPTLPRPTYDQLIKVDGSKLKIIQWITSLERWQCSDFAHKLLKDDVLVSKYEKECKENSTDEFFRKVLKDWLSRDDDDPNDSAAPRTWAALAECVTDAGLPGALAKAIRDAFPSGLLAQFRAIHNLNSVNQQLVHFIAGLQ